jgi:hypothetical protein
MSCRIVLRRLKVLEDKVYVKLKVDESAAELMELLRRHEEDLEKLRSMPGYTVDWEVQIAKEVVRDLIKKGLIDGAGADDFFE